MRMKDDHMRNGQLKAGYNIQTGTQNQYILNYSLHRRAGDTSCLQEHLEKFQRNTGTYPENLIADAGYGSEENYAYLERRGVAAFVKYQSFHYEQKRNYKKKKLYRAENMEYAPETDQYTCPQGKKLNYIFTKDVRSWNGYHSTRRIYECEDCSDCPVKTACTWSKYNRRIYRGEELIRLRREAHERLMSPKGVKNRRKRGIEVEASEISIEIMKNCGYCWMWARRLIDLGDALLGRNDPGDLDRARETYQQSLGMFTEMGAPGYIKVVEERLGNM